MEIEFTDEAIELLNAACFRGDIELRCQRRSVKPKSGGRRSERSMPYWFEEALEHLGPRLLERADSFGRTYANIAGREIRLRVVILNGDKAIIDGGRSDA